MATISRAFLLACVILLFVGGINTNEQVASLDNAYLRIVTIQQVPYVFVDDTLTGNARFSGFAIDLWKAVLKRAGNNITYDIYLTPDGQFGSKNSLGQWNGVIGELVNGNADMVMGPLTITTSRYEAMDVTIPFRQVGLRVMVPKQTKNVDQLSFLDPFTARLWVTLLFTSMAVALAVYALDAFSPFGFRQKAEDDDERRSLNVPTTLYSSLAALIGMGGNSLEMPRSWSVRLMALSYFFFILIVGSSYTANLTAFLTVKRLSTPIANVEDIRNQRVKFGVVNNTAITTFFETTELTDYSVMIKNMVKFPTFEAAAEALRREEIPALIHTSEIVDYIVTQPPCDTLQVGELFNAGYYGIPLPKNSSMVNILTTTVLELLEDGTVDELHDKWYIKMGTCSDESSISAEQIDLENLGGLFYMLFIFFGGALFILGIEIILHRSRNQSNILRHINKFCGNHDVDKLDEADSQGVSLEVSK